MNGCGRHAYMCVYVWSHVDCVLVDVTFSPSLTPVDNVGTYLHVTKPSYWCCQINRLLITSMQCLRVSEEIFMS